MTTTRRDLLAWLLVAGGGYGVLRAGVEAHAWLTAPPVRYEAMARPPGFRRLVTGASSAVARDPFIGLEADPDAAPRIDVAAIEARPCDALFGDVLADRVVPIASFSDYACPYCRVLTPLLVGYAARTDDVRVRWHELPLLGDASATAARAALAADGQGAYAEVHARLMRTRLVPTEATLRAMAAELGLDPDRLLADMDGPAVARRLAESRAVAALLGIVGTPVTVIGRTVVQGSVDLPVIERIVAEERAAGPGTICP